MSGALLLTGGTGFLGSHLLRHFLNEGHEVVVAKRSFSDLWRIRDLTGRIVTYDIDLVPLETLFKEHRFATIVHSATNYGRREIEPTEVVDSNLVLPLHLLQLGVKHGLRTFINTDTLLDKRVSHYSLSKSHFSDWLRYYSSKVHCVNVALTHFYGPQDDGSKFVTQMIRELLSERPSIQLTPGQQKRDMLHVQDVVSAFAQVYRFALERPAGFDEFEVGSGRSHEIREIVQTIKRLSGNQKTRLEFGALPYRPNEAMNILIDPEPLRRLGWQPTLSLEEGLARTIESERKQATRL